MARSGRNSTRPKSGDRTEPTPTRMSSSPAASAAPAAPTASSTPALALARRAAQLCLDYKANDVTLLDLRGVTDMTDFFVIASGTSDTHVSSIGQHLVEDMKAAGHPAYHIEGLNTGRWVLLDFVDFVVHVFHPTLRTFYSLERLWSDAEVIPVHPSRATA